MTVLNRRRTVNLTVGATPIGAGTFTTQTTAVLLGDCMLHQWIVRIPNGHAGLTGVALQLNGVTIVPFDNTSTPYVVGNDSEYTFDVETEVDSGLAVAQLNQDFISHTHYLQFSYTPISASTVGAPQPAPQILAVH